MTHGQNFMREMAEAYQALEREPGLLRLIDEMRAATQSDGDTIARLERKLMERFAEIDELRAKLRSVEAERDDAGFRQLEAEDKATTLQRVVENLVSSLGETLAAVTGDGRDRFVRMAQSEVNELAEYSETKAKAAAKQAEEEAKPVADPTPADATSQPVPVEATTASPSASEGQVEHGTPSDEDQREPDPTALSPSGNPSSNAPSQDAETSSDAVPRTSDDPGPYVGKIYRTYPANLSESEWIAGGGTHESYWEDRNPNI